MVGLFLITFHIFWRKLWRISVTITNMWRKSVTVFRHKLWRNSNTPSQFVTETDGFRHNFVTDITYSVTKTLPMGNSTPGICDGISVTISVTKFFVTENSVTNSVTNFLWRKISVTIFPSQKFVTEFFPSQFPSQIVTDPSQNKLWRSKFWRSDFRHNFRHKMNFSVTIPENFRHNFRHN